MARKTFFFFFQAYPDEFWTTLTVLEDNRFMLIGVMEVCV